MVIFSILQTEKQRLREIKPFAQVIEQVIAEPGAPEPRPRPAKAYPRGHCLPADLPSLPQAPASSCLAPTKAPNPAILPGPAAPFSSRETSSPTSPTSPSIPQTLKTRPALKVSKGDSQFSHRAYRDWAPRGFPSSGLGKPGPELRHTHSTNHSFTTCLLCTCCMQGSGRVREGWWGEKPQTLATVVRN